MFLIREEAMFPIGFGTVAMYLLSLAFFLFAAFNKNYYIAGIALAALFFIIPSVIIGIMMKQRMNS